MWPDCSGRALARRAWTSCSSSWRRLCRWPSLRCALAAQALLGDLFERATVALQDRFSARQTLIAFDHDVDILRIELNSVANALGDFRGGQRGATAQEWVVDRLTDRKSTRLNSSHLVISYA